MTKHAGIVVRQGSRRQPDIKGGPRPHAKVAGAIPKRIS